MYLAVILVLFAKVLSKLTVICDVVFELLQFKYFVSLAEKSLFWPIFLGAGGQVPLELLIQVSCMHLKCLKFVIERNGKWY